MALACCAKVSEIEFQGFFCRLKMIWYKIEGMKMIIWYDNDKIENDENELMFATKRLFGTSRNTISANYSGGGTDYPASQDVKL